MIAYSLQALTALLLAACMLGYARINRRPVVLLWGGAWLLLAVGLAGSGLGVWLLLMQGAPAGEPSRLLAAFLNVGGRISGAGLLVAGAHALTHETADSHVDRSTARTGLGIIAVGLILGAVGTLASAGGTPFLRIVVRVHAPGALVILALATACWVVSRHGTRGAGFGRGFLVAALLVWMGTKTVLLFGGDTATSLLVVFADLFALFVVSVASVVWLLEEERARLSVSQSDLASAREAIQAQLDFEESLADVSIEFINAPQANAAGSIQMALERLAPHLDARAAWYLDMRAGVLERTALWSSVVTDPPERIDPADFPTGVERLRQGRPVRLRRDPDSWQLPAGESANVESLLHGQPRILVPCVVGGDLAGLVGFDVDGLVADHESDVRFKLVAEVFSALLTRLRAAREEGLRGDRIFAAFRALPDVVGVARLSDAVLVEVNRGFEQLFGWDRDDVVGQSLEAVRLWPNREAREDYLTHVASDGTVNELAVDLLARDGSVRPVLLSGRLVDIAGEVCVLSIARDRTGLLNLEEQLRQAQRLEAVGRLAGGIAHDFNNLLTVIGGEASLLSLSTESEEIVNSAREILQAQERGSDLTAQLLAFARQQPRAVEQLELRLIVTGMESLLARLLDARLKLTMDVECDVKVTADKSQIEQVIMNLVVNARDVIGDNGTIRLSVKRVDLDVPIEDSGTPVPAGSWAVMEVTDDGGGMGPEVIATIFDPFFTTKEVGKGTGLGLSTVYGIAQQTGGHVAVESRLGEGSSFRIYLPASADEHHPIEARPAALFSESGTETILVIEDDRAVRELVKLALERAGFTVLTAVDGADGIQTAAAWEGPLDLILSDLVMPGASGSEVVAELAPRRPEAKIMLMTGFHDALPAHGGLPAGASVIRKPFSPRELVSRVRELLKQPSRG